MRDARHRRNTVTKSLAVPALIALLAMVLSSCSSDGPKLPLPSPSSASSSSSATADPSTELFGRLRPAATKVRSLHFVADATASEIKGRSGALLNVSGSGEATFGAGKISALQATVETDEIRGKVVFDDTGIYLRLGDRNAPGGKPWLKYGRSSLPERYQAIFVAFGVLVGPVDPMFAAALQPGATNVRKRLETTEAGVRVTPYAMDVDSAKVARTASILQRFNGTGGQLSAKLNVDQQDRPITLGMGGDNGNADFSLNVSYSKYDSPVSITAPPASQVAD